MIEQEHEAACAQEHAHLVEQAQTSLPNLSAQIDAIEELERVLDPHREEPSFVISSTSTGL